LGKILDKVEFGPKWVGLIAVALIAAALSGRAFYMDGVDDAVQAMFHWYWFPQPTPRRFFAIMWNTGLVRIASLAAPRQIEMAALLYATTTFSQIIIPAAVIASSHMREPVKSVLAAVFFSAVLILSDFSVSESLFALGLTTIFTVYTLDPSADPRAFRRLFVAVLLIASYESVVLSNILLAISCWRASPTDGLTRRMRWALIVILCVALPFQIALYLINSKPNASAGLQPFIVVLVGVHASVLMFLAIYFRVVRRFAMLRYTALALVFVAPIALFNFSTLLHLRSDLFRFAYPSRIYAVVAAEVIALLPLLIDVRLWNIPTKIMDWFGARALKDLAVAMCVLFCGLTVLSTLETFAFRSQMERQFAFISGRIPIVRCKFCLHPEAFGVADLGFPWTWQEYSMAYSMHIRNRPALVIMTNEQKQPFSASEVDAFIAALDSERR
jgi:hypothetical protein